MKVNCYIDTNLGLTIDFEKKRIYNLLQNFALHRHGNNGSFGKIMSVV